MDAGEIYLLGKLYQNNQQQSYRTQMIAGYVSHGLSIYQAEQEVDAHLAEVAANQGRTFTSVFETICMIGWGLFGLFVLYALLIHPHFSKY